MADFTVPAELTPTDLAREAFLSRQHGHTRNLYEIDLRIFYEWCSASGLDVLSLKRPHLELFMSYLQNGRGNSARSVQRRMNVIRQFYRLAHSDELVERDPTVMLKMPRVMQDPDAIAWLEPYQVANLLRVAEAESPAHHALIALMSMLGLRVSEACACMVEDFAEDENGYRTVTVHSKGGYTDVMPVPTPLWRIVERAAAGRSEGSVIRRRNGNPQSRHGAYAWVRILAAKAGLREDLHPHSLRHSAITALVDSGADILTAMRFARHRDPRTTEHYYRRRDNYDAHGAHVLSRLLSR